MKAPIKIPDKTHDTPAMEVMSRATIVFAAFLFLSPLATVWWWAAAGMSWRVAVAIGVTWWIVLFVQHLNAEALSALRTELADRAAKAQRYDELSKAAYATMPTEPPSPLPGQLFDWTHITDQPGGSS